MLLKLVNYKTLLVALLTLSSSCASITYRNAGYQAQALQEKGKYIEAIAKYRLHIASRLERKTGDENPYIYYLLISDCYLELGDLDSSKQSILLAKKNGVNKALVAERIRLLARKYEKLLEFDQSIELLGTHRDLDPLMFDLEIDRIHKEYVAREIELERNKNEKIDSKQQ